MVSTNITVFTCTYGAKQHQKKRSPPHHLHPEMLFPVGFFPCAAMKSHNSLCVDVGLGATCTALYHFKALSNILSHLIHNQLMCLPGSTLLYFLDEETEAPKS